MTKRIGAFLVAGLLSCVSLSAVAQDAASYPARSVQIVAASAPGGTSDFIARMLADHLTKRLGQTFVVDNRPGAASNIGAEHLARSTPDGYTLGVVAVNTHAINPSLYKHLTYSHIKDFTPISLVSTYPNVLVVNPERVSARTVPEFIDLLKKEPGTFTFASSGNGSSLHLSGELFMMMTGTNMIHVPYKSGGPMLTDLLGGHVDLSFDNMPNSLPHVKTGKLIALGVTGAKRVPSSPDIPAIAEFVPDYESSSWHGLAAPAGVPPAIIQKLSTEVMTIMKSPEVQKLLSDRGGVAVGSTPEEFAEHIKKETAKWAEVVKTVGLTAE